MLRTSTTPRVAYLFWVGLLVIMVPVAVSAQQETPTAVPETPTETPTVVPETPTATPTVTPQPAKPGDLNGDGVLSPADADLIIELILYGTVNGQPATTEQRALADLTGDGEVTAQDAQNVFLLQATILKK